MALGVFFTGMMRRGTYHVSRGAALSALLMGSASCVPSMSAEMPGLQFAEAEVAATPDLPGVPPAIGLGNAPTPAQPTLGLFGLQAEARNAALPVSELPNPAATSLAFRGRTGLDQLRSLDCLAQAIYYEARSESEDGQRAVAQVVLNRVRHPAWPNSVCGVVYQGPMRPGGGCQFTFTCDGSLAMRPAGIAWARARLLASEALAGRIFAPAGLATHYHTSAVFPAWAPRLVKTGVIGAHNFYRLPGAVGGPAAFNAAYAGSEPLPRPAMTMRPRNSPTPDFAALLAPPATAAEIRSAVTVQSDIPQDSRWTASNLPESTIREEFRQSGQWRSDAPASMTGQR